MIALDDKRVGVTEFTVALFCAIMDEKENKNMKEKQKVTSIYSTVT